MEVLKARHDKMLQEGHHSNATATRWVFPGGNEEVRGEQLIPIAVAYAVVCSLDTRH